MLGARKAPAGDEGCEAPGPDGPATARSRPTRGRATAAAARGSRRGRQLEARPAAFDRRREQDPGEVGGHAPEPPAPLADRRLGPPQGRRDPAHALAADVELERRSDHVDRVPAVRGDEPGQQGIRPPAAPAAHAGHEDAERARQPRRWRWYPDQGPVGPPQAGQRTAGGATSRPRAAYVLTSSGQGHTITDGGPSLHHRPSGGLFPRGVTWFCGPASSGSAPPAVDVSIQRGHHQRVHAHTVMPPTTPHSS